MWIALGALPGIEKRDLSSLRFCGSGGAPLPVEVAQRFERLTGYSTPRRMGHDRNSARRHQPSAKGPGAPRLDRPAAAGHRDATSSRSTIRAACSAFGEIGEMRIKGPNVFQGYWNRPEETAAAFVDGFFLTGDIGYMDEDGYLFLVDRKKDMIISGGFNVYPQMMEQAIYEHPDVEEVMVIGVPDAYRGEAGKAFMRMRASAPLLTIEALQAFLADKIGRHEMPTELEIRPLPAAHADRKTVEERARRGREAEARENDLSRRQPMREAVIVSTARTPIGKAYRGAFNMTHGATLGGHVIKHAVERAKIDPAEVEDVIMGCALPERATGQNIARQAALRAGLPVTTGRHDRQPFLLLGPANDCARSAADHDGRSLGARRGRAREHQPRPGRQVSECPRSLAHGAQAAKST